MFLNEPACRRKTGAKWLAHYNLGDIIDFKTDRTGPDPYAYFNSGLSGQESFFIWSEGKSAVFRADIGQQNYNGLSCDIIFNSLVTENQSVRVYAGDTVLAEKRISNIEKEWSFIIPSDAVKDTILELRFEYPDAVSPQSLGKSGDGRILSVAWSRMVIQDVYLQSYRAID
jgi:hypothetical protein